MRISFLRLLKAGFWTMNLSLPNKNMSFFKHKQSPYYLSNTNRHSNFDLIPLLISRIKEYPVQIFISKRKHKQISG